MSRLCRITPRASQDIEEIADYLATQSSLDSAEAFLSGIDHYFSGLPNFHRLGASETSFTPISAAFPKSNI